MAACAGATGEPRPRADWARAAEGLQMAGFAVFLLLNTTGVLPWSFWLDAISLWPVLVMSAGVKIAFNKSRAPWLLLLGPLLVLGSLTWLASGRRPETPTGPWGAEVLTRTADTTSLNVETALVGARVRLAVATDLPADRLVEGRSLGRSASTRFDSQTEKGVAQVRLEGGKRHGIVFRPRTREHWDLRLPAGLPFRVRIQGAGVGGDLDLTGGALGAVSTEGIFIGVVARLPAPRQDTDVRMKGVFNSVSLSVPEGTPVRVHGAGLPFNAVDRGVRGTEGRPGYNVHVEGIFSAVEVRTDRTISPDPPPPPAPSIAPERPPAEAPPSPPAP